MLKTLLFGSVALGVCVSAAACSSASGPSASAGSASGGDTGFMVDNRGGTTACASSNYQSQLLPSNILFLVDRSGSMNCNLPPLTASAACELNPVAADPTQPTKWSVITTALGSALDQLASVPNTSVGLTFFSDDDVCGVSSTPKVELAPLATQGPQITALKNALANGKPKGGTPIVGAVILAFKHLHEELKAPGNRFVVLVTDGSDSCIASGDAGSGHDDYATEGVTGDVVGRLLNTELPKAATVNIRTFVIGAPGSEPARGLLSKIAFAGNTGKGATCDHVNDEPPPDAECHFDMTRSGDFGADLATALKKITGQAVTCDFDVPKAADGTSVDVSKLNVNYFKNGGTSSTDEVELFRDDTKPCDSGADGWQFIGADQSKIRLCGSVCDTVRSDPKASVVVALGCEDQRIR